MCRPSLKIEDDVAVFQVAFVGFHEAVYEGTELTNDHFAVTVCNHRETIALLTNTRTHRRAKQHSVHFLANVAERVLNDIDRDRVDINRIKWSRVCLNDLCCHDELPLNRINQKVADFVDGRGMPGQHQRR